MSILDDIMSTLKGVENNDSTLIDNEGGENLDIFKSADIDSSFASFIESWNDPEKRTEYGALKESFSGKYMADPAKFLGYLEESPDMFRDVITASQETGVDPEFLYTVAMQEGLAKKMDILLGAGSPVYESDRPQNSYRDIGLDVLFMEQDRAISRGYLDEAIKPDPNNKVIVDKGLYFAEEDYGTIRNEAGLEITYANISSKDALRGMGAVIQLNRDYMENAFKKEEVDFNELAEETQQFWMYASLNAGAGKAERLFKTYGAEPYQNPEFITALSGPPDKGSKWNPLTKWMDNVGRVVGGTGLADMYSTFGKNSSGW